jgi:hypothetical protein
MQNRRIISLQGSRQYITLQKSIAKSEMSMHLNKNRAKMFTDTCDVLFVYIFPSILFLLMSRAGFELLILGL